jgi:hypothetical protein
MIFGAGGQVGRHLLETTSPLGSETLGLTHAEADICDAAAITRSIAKHGPTSIVNAAAFTAVDRAESDEGHAFRVNRDGPLLLAQAAAAADIPFIHISTDYAFDGLSKEPYAETDPVNPQGAYARSKEAGERAVRAAHDRHLILRTAWVYGPFGRNFLTTMLRLGSERDELDVVDDQFGCPTATAKYEGNALPPNSRKALFGRMGRYEMGNGPTAISTCVALARKHGLDPAQMALGFVTSRPFVTSNIIGATTLAQLKTDIEGGLLKLSDAVLKDIEEIHLTFPNPCP